MKRLNPCHKTAKKTPTTNRRVFQQFLQTSWELRENHENCEKSNCKIKNVISNVLYRTSCGNLFMVWIPFFSKSLIGPEVF